MNELTIVTQREVLGKDFRVYGTAEEPLFLAKDVAAWIEHSNPTEMVRSIDNSEKLNSTMFSAGQNREATFLTEDGLYEVLMLSRKPIAKEFKRQVKEILKSIRKHGLYATESVLDQMLSDPDTAIVMLSKYREEREERIRLEAENARKDQLIGELKPRADYTDHILSSVGTLTITQIAADYSMSASRLNKILYEERIQRKVSGQWILYSEHMGKGYTESETISITRSGGRHDSVLHTRWTQKGRLLINATLNKRSIYAAMDRITVDDVI